MGVKKIVKRIEEDFKCFEMVSKLENDCEKICLECEEISSQTEFVIINLKNQMKFKDYSQMEMRKRYDYPSIVSSCKYDLSKFDSDLKNNLEKIIEKTWELRTECDLFETSSNIRIGKFARLQAYLFGDDCIYKNFLDKKCEIMNDVEFFSSIWELLMKADGLFGNLVAHNKDVDDILSSDSKMTNEDHYRSIESLMAKQINELYEKLMSILEAKTNFTVPDSEREPSISRILHPIRQEFLTLQIGNKKVNSKRLQSTLYNKNYC